MAQPTNYAYDYIAGIHVKSGTSYTTDSILAIYPTAKIAELRTDNTMLSINATDAVKFNKGDIAYITPGRTWTFATDCEIALASLVNLVV